MSAIKFFHSPNIKPFDLKLDLGFSVNHLNSKKISNCLQCLLKEPPVVKKGLGSWWDPGKIPGRIPDGIPSRSRFWPAGFSFPAGFSAGSEIPGGQNLAGNLGGKQNSQRPKSCRESRWEAKFAAAIILPGILPRIMAGREIPGGQNLDELHGKNPGKIFGY